MYNSEFPNLVVDVGKVLLEYIEEHSKGDLLITYGDLVRRLPYEFNPRNLDTPLGALSDICKQLGLPLISTIVVNHETFMPGAGYFKYFFPKKKASEWDEIFVREYNRVKCCRDWVPLAHDLGLD